MDFIETTAERKEDAFCQTHHGCDWEIAMLPTARTSNPRYERAEFRLAFARIVTHYWRHGSWLEEGALLRDAARLAPIPGVIVQGRLDLSNLSGTPWELAAAWPG